MKTWLLILTIFFALSGATQTTNYAQLEKRLNEYLALNKKLDFVNLMDYIHPKLFAIAPKESIIKAMEGMFVDEDINMSFDTMYVEKISQSFIQKNVAYKKIDYFMAMSISFKDEAALEDDEFLEYMEITMENAFPGMKSVFDKEKKSFKITGTKIMIALKEEKMNWMFLGYEKDKPAMLKMLYPKEVLEHFKLL